MAPRRKTNLNFSSDVRPLLYAFGDVKDPLDETSRVLDEIMTDYIIETCHEAAAYASYGRRTKIKVDDFKFVLRRDPLKLGRVQNLLQTQAYQQKMRKQFDENDASVGMDKKDLKELEKGEPAAASSKEVKSGRVEKKPRKKKNGQ